MIGQRAGAESATRPYLAALVRIVAAGTVLQLILAVATKGVLDITAFGRAADTIRSAGLHFYGVIYDPHFFWWPYPPGYLPVIAALKAVSNAVPALSFRTLIKLPLIAANGGIAMVVGRFVWDRSGSRRRGLAAAALVVFGPIFVVSSTYLGQFDAVAILPSVIAVALWRPLAHSPRRGLVAGALIGLGGVMKTVPLVVLAAILPRTRISRETVRLAVTGLAVPVVVLAPFVAAAPSATSAELRYAGLAGFGGISLLIQPRLLGWRWGHPVQPSHLTQLVSGHQTLVLAAVVGAVTVFAFARRAPVLETTVLLWLGIYAFGIDFGPHYLIWGIPFFLMAGRLRAVAVLQALVLTPSLILYLKLPAIGVYEIFMVVLWTGFVVAFALQARRIFSREPPADELVYSDDR